MKVLLLNPVLRDGTRSLRVGRCQGKVIVGLWPNVEHGILVSLLRPEGMDPVLLDANFEGLTFEQMLARAVAESPDAVLLLSITAAIDDDREAARRLREALPDAWIAFWGTHATVRPEDYLGPQRTVVLRREIDVTAVEWLRARRAGATTFADVAGVSWWQDGAAQHAPDRPLVEDLDALPMPDHAAMGTGRHVAADTRRPFALVKTSRGCPFDCVFCTTHSMHGNRWRARSPRNVVDEVLHVRRTTGLTDFFFQSDVFSFGRDWTLELCGLLRAECAGITWFCNSRVDTVDREVLQAMKDAGCRLVAFGVESGSDEVLRACRKGTDAARAERTLADCRAVGLPSLTYWVFGLPGETPETIRQTLRFVDRTHPDYAHFYSPTPLPGSRLFERYRIADKVAAGEVRWSDFFQGVSTQFIEPTVTRGDVEGALRRAYLRFYTNPRRLAREALRLRDPSHLRGRFLTAWDMVRNYAVKR